MAFCYRLRCHNSGPEKNEKKPSASVMPPKVEEEEEEVEVEEVEK